MDDRFFTAFLSLSRHRVVGYTLKPFSLRHRLTLEAIGSPLAPMSPRAGSTTPADLILAARICSMADPFEATKGGSWWDKVWLTRMMVGQHHFLRQLDLWRLYIADTAQHPEVSAKKKGNAARDKGVDWKLMVVVSLIEMGFTEDEAWTMPEGRAMFYFYARAIREGAEIDMVTTSAEAKLPAAREAVAKAVERAKAKAAEAARKLRR